MKRDFDLARQILLTIEENDERPQGWIDIEIPGLWLLKSLSGQIRNVKRLMLA